MNSPCVYLIHRQRPHAVPACPSIGLLRRLARILPVVAIAALAGFAAWPVFGAAASLPEGFPSITLSNRARGDEALSALGGRLREVAAFYRVPETELRRRLREDRSLWVDPRGRLLYVCEWHLPPTSEDDPPGEPIQLNSPAGYPYEHTFRLHSRAGATKVIYLDFDGHDASATSWGSDAIARPFDTDSDPSTFSNTERDRIQYIWQRVAEDYAMFDVDVTTEDPGVEALRRTGGSDNNYGVRVVIGGNSSDWYGSAGGVAYLNSFDDSADIPCWVFPKSLSDSEKNIAEAISHEAGHTLGLSHDGIIVNGSLTEYYTGHGNWAPIMGVGYSEPITHWSRGEYVGANNTQDDLTVMTSFGVSYRTDDHGGTIASATPLAGPNLRASGNIERNSDVDYFSFETGHGRVRLTVSPFSRGANLHPLLSVFDSAGGLLLTTNLADTSVGPQTVNVALELPAGRYYCAVEGVGFSALADPGYPDYGSLGQYSLSGALPADSFWLPTAAGAYEWTNSAHWNSATVPLGPGVTVRFAGGIAGDQVITVGSSVTVGSLLLGDTNGASAFTFAASSAAGLNFQAATGTVSLAKVGNGSDALALPVSLLSSLFVTNSGNGALTFGQPVLGPGGLTKLGGGPVVLAASNTFAGATRVLAGTLSLSPGASLASPVIEVAAPGLLDVSGAPLTLASGQGLFGDGAVLGDVTAGTNSVVAPGGSGSRGTLTFSNHLSLLGGATLQFDLAAETSVGNGSNDLVLIAGNLSFAPGTRVAISPPTNGLASPGTYTLMRYGGSLSGGAANLIPAASSNRFSFAFDDSMAGEIRVHISGGPAALVWQGDGSLNRWEVLGAPNWLPPVGASFAQLDSVEFTDVGSNSPAINLVGNLQPGAVTVNSASNYTFSGAGRIVGATGLTKSGPGQLSLNTTNTFSGEVEVQAGRLRVGNSAALGNTNGGTRVLAGAQLDLNAINLDAEAITVVGEGLAGAGVLLNASATAQTNALRFVTLAGDATFGGTGRWDIRARPTGRLAGSGLALTKTGGNELWLAELGDTGLGDIWIRQGLLGIEGTTTLGISTNNLRLSPGTTLALAKTDINYLNKRLFLTNATLRSDAGNNMFGGSIYLEATNTVSVAAGLNVPGAVGGPGGLNKTGAGILSLSTANSFSGALAINAGTVRPRHASAFGTTNGPTIINVGGRLDVNGLNLGAEPFVVQGQGLGNAGAIVNYGSGQNNALRFVTLAGNTTFGGINRWDVRANPTAGFTGNNFNLTKTGPNDIWIVDAGPSGLGNITINDGLLGFQGSTTLGNSSSTLTVNASVLGFWGNGTNLLNKRLTLNNSRLVNGSGSNTFLGPITLLYSNRFDLSGGTTLTLGGALGGTGVLHSISAGRLVLATNNHSTGRIIVSAGTLQVGVGGAFGTLGSGAVSNNGTLVFHRADDQTTANVITGIGTLTKQGAGTLTLAGANTYAGATTVSAGTLRAGHASAFGTTLNGLSVSAGATLDVNGFNLGGEAVVLSGAGVNGNGAIVNHGAAQSSALRQVTLTGPTTFGGRSRWDLRQASPIATGALSANGHALTKAGTNVIWLANLGETFLGDVFIGAGSLGFEGNASLGYATSQVIVSNTGTLALANWGTTQSVKPLLLLGGRVLNAAGTNTFAGPTFLGDVSRFEVAAGSTLNWDGVISGEGAFLKEGAGVLFLTQANQNENDTLILGGTLALGDLGGIDASPFVLVAAGSTFDVTRVTGGFTLRAHQFLAGDGRVEGDTLAAGTIAPGMGIGRLNFAHSLTLAGRTYLETQKSPTNLTNDAVVVEANLTLGGELAVQHIGDPLQNGDAFRLFAAGQTVGAFARLNLPALTSGLHWDTNNLATDGWLRVTSLTPPTLLPVELAGTNLVLKVASDVGITYVLEASATLTPLSWIGVATNLGTGGVLTFETPVDPAMPQRYFRINAY